MDPRSGTATGPVAVMGEALVDMIPDEHGALRPVPGGGPFNAARTIARLGGDVVFVGQLSTDAFGEMLRSRLLADGVQLPGLRTDAPTTLAMAELDSDGAATYRFYLDGTSAAQLTVREAREATPGSPAVLHVGTLGLVLEPTATAVEDAVARVDAQTLVFLDPNCRPAAVRDHARYRDRLDAVLARADLVKVSNDDMAYITPDMDPRNGVVQLLEHGPQVVLLTDGGAEVHVVGRDFRLSIDVPRVSVADTVGAGDAFGGGVVAWWTSRKLDREQLRDPDLVRAAAAYGTWVAAITCERLGADPPTRAEIEARLAASDSPI